MGSWDIIVVGGGHAGCEAALAAARMGCRTLMVTQDPARSGAMSCNPSIGGVGKGQLVKEIDALGGEMGRNADRTGIHFKRLNTRKGSAVRSSRCQSDNQLYPLQMQRALASQERLEVVAGEVVRLRSEGGKIRGVEVSLGAGPTSLEARAVVITSGTFLGGVIHCGDQRSEGGRVGERPSVALSEFLGAEGFRRLRLKTGTPARLFRDSIDWSVLAPQVPDEVPLPFSYFGPPPGLPQVPCYLGYTSERTHEVIRENLHRSPLFSGQIAGIGPRYCPSIEDKVVKFPDKDRHQVFFEPESLSSDWIYPNGVSTSLPAEVQEAFLRTLPGCASVRLARPGYAVEYDCLNPQDLLHTLESKALEGLYFAGQVNGTSGYEEAAAQGLLAGMNAALKVQDRPPLILDRTDSYLGVMVDDLIRLGVNEPYRMFTSRAEYRLSLREDNADLRLSRLGFEAGLLRPEDFARVQAKGEALERGRKFLKQTFLRPTPQTNARLVELGTTAMAGSQSAEAVLRRPEVDLETLRPLLEDSSPLLLAPSWAETLEVEVKYEGYIELQRQEVKRLRRVKEVSIPPTLDFSRVTGLSTELKLKLAEQRPANLRTAANISGMTPAALSALLYHIDRRMDVSSPGTL